MTAWSGGNESLLLDAVLAPGGLTMLLQPIYEVRDGARRLYACECLARGPRGTNLESASVLFSYVRKKRVEHLVDRACIAGGMAAACRLQEALARPGDAVRFHFNVHAATLWRDREFLPFFVAAAAAHGLALSHLTLELIESDTTWRGGEIAQTLTALRRLGVRIALDDVGLGESNFRAILEYEPDYFKLDSFFSRGLSADVRRCSLLAGVCDLARRFTARVVLEGIENQEDLETATLLGIELLQGYHLAVPQSVGELVAAEKADPAP